MKSISLKAQLQCVAKLQEKFSTSRCLAMISVGQENHEGEKFAATINEINRFKNCTIGLDDSLQRHTLVIGDTREPSEAYQDAIDAGDRWLERNKATLENLTIPYEIIRWDHWLNHEDFQQKADIVDDLYKNEPSYKLAIEKAIDIYLARYVRNSKQGIDNLDYERACILCRDYLLEECAVLCLRADVGYEFDVYPSRKRNPAIEETYQVLAKHLNVLHRVWVKFSNESQEGENFVAKAASVEEVG